MPETPKYFIISSRIRHPEPSEEEFLINLNLNLQAKGFSPDIVNMVIQEYQDIGFAKTASKQVLGAMTQLAKPVQLP